jgi:hypothetical protein
METEKNFLENKKVSVKIVDKYRTGFSKDSDGRSLYTGCKQIFQAPTNENDRLLPILTEDEQRWFEEKMGLQKGELAFGNKEKSYWRNFRVTLDKKDKILDLTDYEDFLSYKVLLASKNIANNKDSVNVLQHTFYMVTDEEELEDNSRLSDRYEEASRLFNAIAKSDRKMANVLRIMGKTVVSGASTKWLKSELVKIIEQKAKVVGQLNMDDFIRSASDKDIDTRIFILDALEIGEIYQEGSTYKLRAGDIIGYDFSQAITFFNNPKNQQIKLLIEDRINNNKK